MKAEEYAETCQVCQNLQKSMSEIKELTRGNCMKIRKDLSVIISVTVRPFIHHAYTATLTPSNATVLDSSRPKLKDHTYIFRFDAEMALLEAFVSQVLKLS